MIAIDHTREPLQKLLESAGARFKGTKCLCPFHPNTNTPAADLYCRDNVWRFKCQVCGAGGDLEDVRKLLGGKATFPGNGNGHTQVKARGKIVAVYPYTDESGAVLFEKVRFDPKDFNLRRPDGKGGHVWGMGDARRVLYRLPDLLAATPETIIFLTEGEKDADNLAAAGLVAVTNFEGASKPGQEQKWRAEYNECFRGRIVAVVADKDPAGRARADHIARQLAPVAAEVRVFEVPGDACKDASDYLSAGGDGEGLMALFDAAPVFKASDPPPVAAIEETPAVQTDTPDPEIIPLDVVNLPEVPTGVLPAWAADFVHALSAAKETPQTLAALLTLAAMASTVQRVFRVRIEPAYHETLCIYACPAMESGERKTAIYQPILRPLFDLQKAMRCEAQAEIDKAKITRGLAESELKALRKRFFTEKDTAARAILQKEIEEKTAALPMIPPLPQLVSEDSTEAALAVTLSNNQEAQLVGSDEGGFFDNLAGGRFSADVSELDLFLKAHTGSPHTVNRIGRENLYLHRPLLSIAICPQPHVLTALGDKEGFINRGGLARFLVALPESAVGHRQLIPAIVAEDVRRAYSDRLMMLARMGRAFSEDEPKTLTLSPEAYHAWKAFERAIEPRMSKGADLYGIKPWASKLAGAVARVAAVCHAAEYGLDAALYPVPLDRMAAAIQLGEALIPHALAVHRLMGGGGHNVALAVVEHFDATGWLVGVQTLTDWWRPVRAIVGETSAQFEPVARQLADHGYLIPVDPPQRGGKRGQHFRANNQLFAKSKFESPKVL